MMERSGFTRARILIVDDQAANVTLLTRILANAGYGNIEATTDARQAIEKVEQTGPDILLLDLQMPHLSGLDILKALSQHPKAECLPILVLTADLSASSKQAALAGGAKDFLVKPFDPTEVILRIENLLETRFLHLQLSEQNRSLESTVKERTFQLWASIQDLERSKRDLVVSRQETIRRLSIAAEFRDDETSRHIIRMSHYCGLLAKVAGLDSEQAEGIRTASQMHDIGKLGTPDSILLKPGRLTDHERRVMQQHAEDGWRILHGSESELLNLAASIARNHHERFDGSGYPRGLVGEAIPLSGRIAAIADVFDAISTDRVYRKAFPLPDVWRMMEEGRGSHFDPELLDLFLDSMGEVLALKESNDQSEMTA